MRYKSVEIGVVERVELSSDLEKIHAHVRMSKSVTPLLVEDVRFWVERPRVSGTNVEGSGRSSPVPSSAWTSASRRRQSAVSTAWIVRRW